uniref:Putative MFS-type transporter C09D4.1 n=1 Tax=Aceria tosichella TaxID=561515 RepID=A0A6G1SHQ3_9ACAR
MIEIEKNSTQLGGLGRPGAAMGTVASTGITQSNGASDLVTAHIRGQEITTNQLKANYLDRSDIKPTRKRYLILLLFCLHSAINAAQWIYLSSITSTVSKYYQVDNMAVNWTSMVYMLVYIPLVVPSTWLFERIGMRDSILLGSLGTTLGSFIKCFSCQPGRFGLLMSGQTLVAVSQLFVLSVPPRLASVWFPDHQVSLANACGVFGNQFGIALGFVVPPLLIDEGLGSIEQISSSLFQLFVGIALFSGTVSLLIMFLFDRTPSKPPGLARLQQIKQEEALAEAGAEPLVIDGQKSTSSHGGFGALLWDLFTDINFVLLMASYGLNVGVFYAISTVLNQMISQQWTNANSLVGQLGPLLVVSGMFGSVISGLILDRTRMYRLVNASLYTFSLVSMVLFTATLEWHNMVALYLVVILLGYFMTGYLFIGYEMSNEITWPRPESVTAGLLNLSAQVFGVVLTYLGSYIVDNYGNLLANIFFVVSLSCGLFITLMIRAQLKRQSAMGS